MGGPCSVSSSEEGIRTETRVKRKNHVKTQREVSEESSSPTTLTADLRSLGL